MGSAGEAVVTGWLRFRSPGIIARGLASPARNSPR
jgi:hypothetical protein